jgi:hypothetical protein
MTSTTSTSPRYPADTTSGRNDRRSTTAAATLSVRRLNVMRLGYLVMGVGLAVTKWPLLINRSEPWPPMEGVVTYMLVAMGLLALLGLRYPVKMLPILLFESAWKVLWLTAVALPLWISQQLDAATRGMTYDILWVVMILVVIPWRYVLAQYVTKRGERWR